MNVWMLCWTLYTYMQIFWRRTVFCPVLKSLLKNKFFCWSEYSSNVVRISISRKNIQHYMLCNVLFMILFVEFKYKTKCLFNYVSIFMCVPDYMSYLHTQYWLFFIITCSNVLDNQNANTFLFNIISVYILCTYFQPLSSLRTFQ
jgi:hypothetical protein